MSNSRLFRASHTAIGRLVYALMLLGPLIAAGVGAGDAVEAAPAAAPADGFADAAIRAVWRASDAAVAAGTSSRSWLWGPGPFYTTYEPMDGTPTGMHLVQYFDKGRLEINDAGANRNSPWFVTSGLLVKELVAGRISTGFGADSGEGRPPATAPVAGNPGAGAAPSYPACRVLVEAPPPGDRTGANITLGLSADGQVIQESSPPTAVMLGHYDAQSRHNIAGVFWNYVQAGNAGPAANWVYTLGLPLTEPFWVQARVGGATRDVLVQLFERRSLTYSPANNAPWQVEMGNVGRAYYNWRYADLQPDTKTEATRTRYDVTAHVGDDRGVDVVEHIHYVNTTAAHTPLTELVLRVVYHHWKGAFAVQSAHAGGQVTTTRWRDEVNLAIALPAPLPYGQSVDADLAFGLHPPSFGGRHGYDAADDLLTLGDWLASVVPYENGGWDQFPYAEHGDEGINEVADYQVTFTSDHSLVVGGTGRATSSQGSGPARRWVFAAPGVRDVAYTISPRLLDPYADASLTRNAGGVKVLGYFLPGHRAAGGALLDTVAAAIRWYQTRIGPCPYPVFSVGEMALPREAQWNYDQEYPMMYLIPTQQTQAPVPGTWSWYTPLHEVAHAWFYAAVGNNQIIDPWLDEALANYMAAEYVRAQRPDLYAAAFAAFSGPGGGWPVSGGLFSGFPSDSAYFHAVYDQGTLFLSDVEKAMGAAHFWAALHDYYIEFTGRRARPSDLLAAWQRQSPVDLTPIFERYLAAP